ncbi:MAG: gfo/Idh/MocA family oxidoreductase [Armatimonadota bacterium]
MPDAYRLLGGVKTMSVVRIAIAGCGSVSRHYLNDLMGSAHAQVAAVCDIAIERAQERAKQYQIPQAFGDVDEMLRQCDFDLLVNLTSMQEHYPINLKALQAGKHVLCEKPFATTLDEARTLMETAKQRGVNLWATPTLVTSPAFKCMAELLAQKLVGEVHVARAWYGHGGPGWGPWFYQKGGGSLFDLGVYNITTLTGLLGPAKSVTALMGTAIPERFVEGQHVKVEADDNTIVLMDHGNSTFSCVMTGFVYGPCHDERTIELVGTKGSISMLGWDWHPKGVEVWDTEAGAWEVVCKHQKGYNWNQGGSYLARCLATGKKPLMTIEHAFHVLEAMLAAKQSAETGQRVPVHSQFPTPWLE